MSAAPLSWNRYPRSRPRRVVALSLRVRIRCPRRTEGETCIAYGLGRSYGDVCLNEGGALLRTRGLDRFIAFDRRAGVISCEAGVSLSEELDVAGRSPRLVRRP